MAQEVEKKALLTKQQFIRCTKKLIELRAQDLGENNTITTFYLLPSAQLKVQHATSKKTAKIAWKSGAMGGSHYREEIELSILPDELQEAQTLIERTALGAKKYTTEQRRHDYALGDVIVSLKYSADWGYHVELDVTTADTSAISDSLLKLHAVANALNLQLLSDYEEEKFIEGRLAKH